MLKHELEIQAAERLETECENLIKEITECINHANALINAIEKRSCKR